jgi:CDP-diacylglycerol--glycerol-3-phosphate 3-phosphatidyltransferase
MNLANKLTLLRIILAPVFLVIYFLPRIYSTWTIPVLWIIFLVSEITDYFDGLAARKLNLTSDFGKLFDPFADTLVQITCFLCFVIDGTWGYGILPVILFVLIIYREFGILFLRNLMLKKGITLGASIFGKIKTVTYIIAVGAALLTASIERLGCCESLLPYFKTGALIIFIISVIFAIVSFIDYFLVFKKTGKNSE